MFNYKHLLAFVVGFGSSFGLTPISTYAFGTPIPGLVLALVFSLWFNAKVIPSLNA